MLLGYARVSKGETQDTRLQEAALRTAGVERLFTEQASGGRWERPQLQRLLDQLRPADVVVVWKLDRLSREEPQAIVRPRAEEVGGGDVVAAEKILQGGLALVRHEAEYSFR